MSACDHKFVGSESCLKCGWVPNAAAIASRLQPMHVVPEPVTAPKPGDVVVEPAVTGDHRYLAAFALHNVTPLPGTIGTWARTGEDPRGGMGAEIRIARALATIEHNARPKWIAREDAEPPQMAFCAVEYYDGSVGSAIACDEFDGGFLCRRKWIDKMGRRMKEDTLPPGRIRRYFVVPFPPEPPKGPSR